MRTRPCLSPAIFAALLLTGLARAEEGPGDLPPDAPWQPRIAAHLSGQHGLTGTGHMVDGRIPAPFWAEPEDVDPLGAYSSRFVLRYQLSTRRRELRRGAKLEAHARRQDLIAFYGLTVQGFDLSVGLPYRHELERLDRHGGPDPPRDRDDGIGDLQVGAKVAFRIPNFFLEDWATAAFGAYLLGRIPSGEPQVGRPAQLEAGLAVAGPYGFGFRYNGNLALVQEEGGLTALVVRMGFSGVPLASPEGTLRLYLNFLGREYEGRLHTDIDVEVGGQLLLGGRVSVELGLTWRALDAGRVEPDLQRVLRAQLGSRPRYVGDETSLLVTFGLGVLL